MGQNKWSPSCFSICRGRALFLKRGEDSICFDKITKTALINAPCVIFFNLPDFQYSRNAFPNSDRHEI